MSGVQEHYGTPVLWDGSNSSSRYGAAVVLMLSSTLVGTTHGTVPVE